MNLFRPRTLAEALERLAAEAGWMPVAGGTDLLVDWHHKDKAGWKLLDLTPLRAELAPWRFEDGELVLGALTSYWDVIRAPEIAAKLPLLPEAARQIGAIQIQTRGTWAGNIENASPAADGVPVLMACDARVVLQSVRGQREVPLEAYYTGYRQTVRRPDELIVAIRVPIRPRRRQAFFKVGPRAAQAITKAGLAIAHDEQHGWRVVANSVAPTVVRCRSVEQALDAGRTPTGLDELPALLQQDIAPIDDMRSTAAYRRRVLARLLAAFLRG